MYKNVIPPPQTGEYGEFYKNYILKAGTAPVLETLAAARQTLPAFFLSLPAEKWDYAYAPEKWTVKDILQHLIDGERVFSYRALRIARQDSTPMPGFDENMFAVAAQAGRRSPASLISEYRAVRTATLHLFQHFSAEELAAKGQASGFPVSPRALAYIIAGHEIHHLDVIREKYLLGEP